ncbi:bpX6 domain-containing protein [Orbus wheelerorum]|uniref:bpX6 domain-containing protein n=1 Tax=Orbus wheelerorum TaxID=3074111 RepID=UPI00370D1D86
MLNIINYPIVSPNLKGYQDINGIWLPFIWYNRQQCAELIVEYWFKGSAVYVFEHGYLIRFPYAISKYCEKLDGWPLRYFDGKLCSMVLNNDIDFIPEGDIILLMGNSLKQFNFQDGEKINPALWLDLDEYALLDSKLLPIEITELDYIDPMQDVKDMAEIFGENLPKPSEVLLKFSKKKQNSHAQKQSKSQSNINSKNISSSKFVNNWFIIIFTIFWISIGPLFTWISSLNFERVTQKLSVSNFFAIISPIIWIFIGIILIVLISKIIKAFNNRKIQQIFHKIECGVTKTNYSQTKRVSNPSETEKPKKYHKKQPWRKYLTVFAIFSKLHHLIAFRQGKYLDSMMKLFETGNLDEALKHAIPINGEQGFGQQFFGVPKPRNKLSLSEKIYGQGSSIYFNSKIQNRINQLYQKSFEQLVKENRVEEATFVLIELLNNLNKGIEFLEQNLRYQQALDIAIARDADPDIIVRLCCLTQQWDKAIIVAKRNNAFANAIMFLERDNQQSADNLRLIWANTLAERGEWLAAIDAIWPLKENRYLAEIWFDYAEKTEEYNANIIVKRLILQPDAISLYQQYIEQLQVDPTLYQERLALTFAILQHKKYIKNLRVLLSLLINVIISDIIQYTTAFNKADMLELLALSDDKALKFDLAMDRIKIKTHQSLAKDKNCQKIVYSSVGQRIIYDAVPIRNGNYLIALGEAGIVVVDKMGKQLKHYMIAAYDIVLSHNLNQVLLLAKREDSYCVYKLDLATEKSMSLGYLKFDIFLSHFDGLNWTIIDNNVIQVLNIEESPSIVWRMDLGQYRFDQVLANSTNEKWLLETPSKQYEIWNYSLPTRRLVARDEVQFSSEKILLKSSFPDSYYHYSKLQQKILFKQSIWHESLALPFTINEVQYETMSVTAMNDLVVFCVPKEQEVGIDIYLYAPNKNEIKMVIEWQNSSRVSMRTTENYLIVWDKKGRCAKLDVQKNEIICFTV